MLVEIDRKSGFCFGVENAVGIAEQVLARGEKVYSLGPIVHNDMEMERLHSLGLIVINHDDFRKLKDCNVLIRAHGEPPETYKTATENNITIIEATCPIVKKLQSRISNNWLNIRDNEGQIVIFGKPGHAEVIGLMGHTGKTGILVSYPDDLKKIDLTKKIFLFSQTTMSLRDYHDFAELIRLEMRKKGIANPDRLLKVNNTICGQVSNREPHLRSFAGNHDVVIFVSGKESSNGRMLFSTCKSVNPETYFISSPEDIDPEWFSGKNSVGICGATSTPRWLIKKVYNYVTKL